MNMAKSEAQKWARKMLDFSCLPAVEDSQSTESLRAKHENMPMGEVLILDTETCGLNGEVIECAIIDLAGNPVYVRRYKPLTAIHPGAFAVHGISLEMLEEERDFCDEYEELRAILEPAKMVLIYNAAFDARCLLETCRLHEQAPLVFKSGCIMNWYAIWHGEKNRSGYRMQKLTGGDHSAVGDCRAALAFLRRMAALEQVA